MVQNVAVVFEVPISVVGRVDMGPSARQADRAVGRWSPPDEGINLKRTT